MNFNIDEVFEIAEQIERNGARFYRKAAKKRQRNSSYKKVLLELG
jgi:rubrerythrin